MKSQLNFKILLNGLGCPYSGARLVLQELLLAVPKQLEVKAYLPVVNGYKKFDIPSHVIAINLSHKIWGRYLRPVYELLLNFELLLGKYNGVVNLSYYGLYFSTKQILYLHHPGILVLNNKNVNLNSEPLKLKRWMLDKFLQKSEYIIVQTDHMAKSLTDYCLQRQLPLPSNCIVMKPLPRIKVISSASVKRSFVFQFFYPASNFPHKRTDLAIDGIVIANKKDTDIGLEIICNTRKKSNAVNYYYQISHDEVLERFNISDALLFTSERETLGLPLLEALYYGKPAVLPALPYAQEIYGDAAVYYEHNDPQSISHAIIELKNNYKIYAERAKLRKKKEWKKRITWEEHWISLIKYFN